jgi:hypothetical protein
VNAYFSEVSSGPPAATSELAGSLLLSELVSELAAELVSELAVELLAWLELLLLLPLPQAAKTATIIATASNIANTRFFIFLAS